jgi:hypothetical protein
MKKLVMKILKDDVWFGRIMKNSSKNAICKKIKFPETIFILQHVVAVVVVVAAAVVAVAVVHYFAKIEDDEKN